MVGFWPPTKGFFWGSGLWCKASSKLRENCDRKRGDRQTDVADTCEFIICPMLCYSNQTDNKQKHQQQNRRAYITAQLTCGSNITQWCFPQPQCAVNTRRAKQCSTLRSLVHLQLTTDSIRSGRSRVNSTSSIRRQHCSGSSSKTWTCLVIRTSSAKRHFHFDVLGQVCASSIEGPLH